MVNAELRQNKVEYLKFRNFEYSNDLNLENFEYLQYTQKVYTFVKTDYHENIIIKTRR